MRLKQALVTAMNDSSFVRIEREGPDGSKHYVIHTHDPKFALELAPDGAAPDKMGRGVIKSIRVPNSWAGDYSKYSKYITAAQHFFEVSFAPPVSKAETKRFSV
jgi:hypothetical protein